MSFHKTYDTYRGLNVRSFAIFEPVPRPRYLRRTYGTSYQTDCVLSNLVLNGKVLIIVQSGNEIPSPAQR